MSKTEKEWREYALKCYKFDNTSAIAYTTLNCPLCRNPSYGSHFSIDSSNMNKPSKSGIADRLITHLFKEHPTEITNG